MHRLALVLLVHAGACSGDKPARPADAGRPRDAAIAIDAQAAAVLDAAAPDAAAPAAGTTSRVVELAVGKATACTRRADGHVRCWGKTAAGRPPQTVPAEVPSVDDAIAIDVDPPSGELSIVRSSGDVARWSLDTPATAPTALVTGEPDIVAARRHASDLYTLTRTNDLLHRSVGGTPRRIAGDIIALDRLAGGHIVALDRDGVVSVLRGERAPTKIRGLADATALVGGNCAKRRTGALTCWDADGRPRPWQGPTNAVDRRAGLGFSCDLTSSGVACAGRNDVGQLGEGAGPDRRDPKVIALPAKPSALGVGESFACALVTSGEVACWGLNDTGQLGDGTRVDRGAPRAVAGVTSEAALALPAEPTLPSSPTAMDWGGLPTGCTRPASLALWDKPTVAKVISAYAHRGPGALRILLADFALPPLAPPRTGPLARGTQRVVELQFTHAAGKKPLAVDRGLYRTDGGPRSLTVITHPGDAPEVMTTASAVIEKIDATWVCGQLLDPTTPTRRQPFAARLSER